MNPLRLYDYVYYCFAILYNRVWDYSESHEEAGIGLVSLFQLCNILFLIHLLNLKELFFKKNGIIIYISIYLVIIVLNFIRYKKVVKLENLEMKFDNQNSTIRIIKIITVIIYGFLSLAVLGL